MMLTRANSCCGYRDMADIQHFIDGKRADAKSGRWGDVFNPATGEKIRRVALGGAGEIDAAVQSAAKAFPGWAATPPLTRARVLFKFLELLAREHDNLARAISEEHGKVFSDAQGEITRGVEVVEFACGIPHLLKGEFTEQGGRGRACSTSSTATRRRSTRSCSIPGSPRSALSARPRSPNTSMRPRRRPGNGCRRLAAPRTTWW